MNFDELVPILKLVFPETDQFTLEMTKSDIPSWDSIAHLNLIIEVEDAFGVSFEMDEIESLNSLKGLLEILNRKVNAK
jgi:acyl carrier protein